MMIPKIAPTKRPKAIIDIISKIGPKNSRLLVVVVVVLAREDIVSGENIFTTTILMKSVEKENVVNPIIKCSIPARAKRFFKNAQAAPPIIRSMPIKKTIIPLSSNI